ncbi:MAG: glycosyltransferase [Candidatus Thiodiazotropha weberae]|nr:glycosyltransferase [Candidatus Thiodiazotropha lotti]MCG8010174.1 glycosyltransferase [Candidatus Thiodiazotropha lotti]MCG8021629.1 glycosyltransferase [Candidatus Thiodiazotropha lotti]MCW4208798.1 glycosyltransferase [Candidatus Thiodiazotropha lotti]MCW4209632.1 glycosyltransferase [Candidatus Thiodiazotropha lotti]
MKVLHLIDSGGLFGAEKVLLSLVKQQMHDRMEPIIGSINDSPIKTKALELEAKTRGYKIHKFIMKPGISLSGANNIINYAKKNRVDIMHSHGYKANILIGLQPRFFRKIPIISTMHGWTNTKKFSKMRLNQELDAFALRHVDKIVLVSKGMLTNKKISKLPKEKLTVIENGVDIVNVDYTKLDNASIIDEYIYEEELRCKLKSFCNKSIVVGTVGRLSKEKGFEYLIEAIYLVRKKVERDVKLLIIGDGVEKDNLLERISAYDLDTKVMFTGYVDNAFNLLPLFDIFALSSLTEGLPITLLEAMQYSLPIVSTNVGGIPYVIENKKSGLLVNPLQPKELADSIELLINDEAYAIKLAEQSKSIFLDRYSSGAMATKYHQIYQKLVTA